MMDKYKVSQAIKRLRELRNFTQEQVADELQISLRSYNTIENNPEDMSIGLLHKLSELLQTSPAQLLELDISTLIQNNKIQGSGFTISGNAYTNDINRIHALYSQRIEHLEEEVKFLRDLLSKKS